MDVQVQSLQAIREAKKARKEAARVLVTSKETGKIIVLSNIKDFDNRYHEMYVAKDEEPKEELLLE